jgi:hypothetical protein
MSDNNNNTATKVMKASELGQLLDLIHRLRNPSAQAEHDQALAEYQKARGKRKEVKPEKTNILGYTSEGPLGFYKLVDGEPEFIERPVFRRPVGWRYTGYEKGTSRWGGPTYAQQGGLLTGAKHNREIRPERVYEYEAIMETGNWRDLLSDPITITSDGQVVNGQHRLAAASRVDWSKVENDPSFLVITGVDPLECLFADGSRRTEKDEKTIAFKAAFAGRAAA